MTDYTMTYAVRWSDLDANGHVNYAAYIDATGDLRYRFFSEHGYPAEKFLELGVAPIYTAIQARFLREVRMGETVTITYHASGFSPDGARWKVHHDVLKANGKKAVIIDLEGAILNLATRRPVAPPPEVWELFQLIPRSAEFEILSSGSRGESEGREA